MIPPQNLRALAAGPKKALGSEYCFCPHSHLCCGYIIHNAGSILSQNEPSPHGDINHGITYYDTFEERESAFRQATHAIFPRRHQGPAQFWKDFKQIWGQKETFEEIRKLAIVTPHPGDGLVFGTPKQELAAAIGWPETDTNKIAAKTTAIADLFELTNHLDQPLRTLSGGETVRLALAKVFAASDWADKLVMAAPFAWMDHHHNPLVGRVIEQYQQNNIPAQVMALAGEIDPETISSATTMGLDINKPLQFSLMLKEVQIPLANLLERIGATSPMAAVDDFETTLTSPCLLAGGNGQGKSLLAKVLANAIDHSGQTMISSEQKNNDVRLLFQDVVAQSLLRPWTVIRQKAPTHADALFKKLHNQFNHFLQEAQNTQKSEQQSAADNPAGASLLDLKLMLVAARLAHGPAAIILDEPDWGFSRQTAIAFVAAVVKTAHARGVAVLLISHKPWWRQAAPSTLRVEKKILPLSEENPLFRIQLKADRP